MSEKERCTRYTTEYVELAGEHLDKVDDRIRHFDLEIDALIRDAEVFDVAPSVPNHKRITELVLLLLQIRDQSSRINEFLLRSISRHAPNMSQEAIEDLGHGLGNLERILHSDVDGVPFIQFVKQYLETIDYPGYSHIERGVTQLDTMESYKVAYTPGVARMCLLIQSLNAHIALLTNISFMDLRGRMRKVIHVLQDRLIEAVRSLTGSTGSIHIPRLSHGTRWRNPSTRVWETHPVLLAAKAYIESLPGPICLVVTDQTAVLGLEDIGPLGGHPVMVGKAKINASAGRFTALPVSIESTDDDSIIAITEFLALAHGVRAINLEDITGKSGRCFSIQRQLQERLLIPVFHDDQDGTAIITLAGLFTALEDQNKKLNEVRIVISGAGAAGIKIARFLIAAGARAKNIVMLDSRGILSDARPDIVEALSKNDTAHQEKLELLREMRNDLHGALAEVSLQGKGAPSDLEAALDSDRRKALEGADIFIGMSVANIITADNLRNMATRPIVFACANPEPEIPYEEAVASRDDIIVGSGSSLYPNQINNAVAFPGLLAGLMLSCARTLDIDVGVIAARAIARRTSTLRAERSDYRDVVPRVIDAELHLKVALATARDVFSRGLNLDQSASDEAGPPSEAVCLAELERRFASHQVKT